MGQQDDVTHHYGILSDATEHPLQVRWVVLAAIAVGVLMAISVAGELKCINDTIGATQWCSRAATDHRDTLRATFSYAAFTACLLAVSRRLRALGLAVLLIVTIGELVTLM